MNATISTCPLISDAGLMDAAGDRVGDQLLVSLAPGAAVIDLPDKLAAFGVAVGVDPGERADPAGGGPGARAFPIRNRDALAALDERQDLAPGDQQRIERLHQIAPCRTRPDKAKPALSSILRRPCGGKNALGKVRKHGTDPPIEQKTRP